MRPYLAIIKDSFRAAIASRVLYVFLLLITLLLAAIAPLCITERVNWKVNNNDIIDERRNDLLGALDPFRRLDEKIVEAARRDEPSPRKLIWEKLSPNVQSELEKLYDAIHESDASTEPETPQVSDERDSPGKASDSESAKAGERKEDFGLLRLSAIISEFRADINRVIESEDLYDQTVWQNKRQLDPEIQELLDQGRLNRQQQNRLNRLLVSEAFSQEIAKGIPTTLAFSYIWEFTTQPLRRAEVKAGMAAWMPWLLDKGVLAIGIFVAILVTAPIIPQTFDPGALSLLLSKPVSRSMLLLSKFVGGCAFISICAIYLFVGMWLIFGVRLGIWNNAILVSIPIYILVFAIYYSVSTTAGIIWRNTVICVVFAVLFWLACFSLGTLDSSFEKGLGLQRLTFVVEDENRLFANDQAGTTYLWNESTRHWDLVMVAEEAKPGHERMYWGAFFFDFRELIPQPMRTIYLSEYDQLVLGQPSQTFAMDPTMVVGSADSGWLPKEVIELPKYTLQLLSEPNGKMLAITADGKLFRLKADPLKTAASLRDSANEAASKAGGSGQGILSTLLGKKKDEFFEELKLVPPFKIGPIPTPAMNASTGQIALLSRNSITFIEPDGDGYRGIEDKQIELTDIDPIRTIIAFGGSKLVAARGNGETLLYDVNTTKLVETFTPDLTSASREISASSDGRWFAITLNNGDLWILDTAQQSIEKANVRGQGDVSLASFARDGQLWVCDRTNRLSKYSIEGFKVDERLSPRPTGIDFAFRYIVHPLYIICPKPSEFYKLIDHLTRADTKDEENDDGRSQPVKGIQEQTTNPWSPLWTGLAFMVIMLAFACFYFERQEF